MRAQPKMSTHGLTPVETCIAVLGNGQMGFFFWHLIFSAGLGRFLPKYPLDCGKNSKKVPVLWPLSCFTYIGSI